MANMDYYGIYDTPDYNYASEYTVNTLVPTPSYGIVSSIAADSNGVLIAVPGKDGTPQWVSLSELAQRLERLEALHATPAVAANEKSNKQQSESHGVTATIQVELDGLDRYFEEREI